MRIKVVHSNAKNNKILTVNGQFLPRKRKQNHQKILLFLHERLFSISFDIKLNRLFPTTHTGDKATSNFQPLKQIAKDQPIHKKYFVWDQLVLTINISFDKLLAKLLKKKEKKNYLLYSKFHKILSLIILNQQTDDS